MTKSATSTLLAICWLLATVGTFHKTDALNWKPNSNSNHVDEDTQSEQHRIRGAVPDAHHMGGGRRTQAAMGTPLADGYGGSGGVSKEQALLPMRQTYSPGSGVNVPPVAAAIQAPVAAPTVPVPAPGIPVPAPTVPVPAPTVPVPAPTLPVPAPTVFMLTGPPLATVINQVPTPQTTPLVPQPTSVLPQPTTPAVINPSPTTTTTTITDFGTGSNVTFLPGQLTVMERNLILSQGLTSKIIAVSGMPVLYENGQTSAADFHVWPDGAATFVDTRPGNNDGGWVWVSNAEDKNGGVGSMTFDKNGNVVDYRMILTSTVYNCNGGKTPWYVYIMQFMMEAYTNGTDTVMLDTLFRR